MCKTKKARLEIDRNGNGAQIFAYAFHLNHAKGSRCGARYLHELVWQRHYGGIAPGFVIQHKNAITMDNRLENLQLVPVTRYNPFAPPAATSSSVAATTTATNSPVAVPPAPQLPKQIEHSLYWAAIQQLPPEHLADEVSMQAH